MPFQVLFFCFVWLLFGVDHYVVHIDCEGSVGDLFAEYGIHHGLECGW